MNIHQKLLFRNLAVLGSIGKRLASSEDKEDIPQKIKDIMVELNQLFSDLADKPVPIYPAMQPALRPVPMGLFPTMGSLQQVVDLANSQLPINTPNAVLGLLMAYHNTLIKVIQDEQKAVGSN